MDDEDAEGVADEDMMGGNQLAEKKEIWVFKTAQVWLASSALGVVMWTLPGWTGRTTLAELRPEQCIAMYGNIPDGIPVTMAAAPVGRALIHSPQVIYECL